MHPVPTISAIIGHNVLSAGDNDGAISFFGQLSGHILQVLLDDHGIYALGLNVFSGDASNL
jgi:hypothetical protein